MLLWFAPAATVWGAVLPTDYSGAEVYAQYCARCHANAVGGAPRLPDLREKLERQGIGRADLLLAVLKGRGGMPPKGGNASLSVGEANAALDYILSATGKR